MWRVSFVGSTVEGDVEAMQARCSEAAFEAVDDNAREFLKLCCHICIVRIICAMQVDACVTLRDSSNKLLERRGRCRWFGSGLDLVDCCKPPVAFVSPKYCREFQVFTGAFPVGEFVASPPGSNVLIVCWVELRKWYSPGSDCTCRLLVFYLSLAPACAIRHPNEC